METYRVPRREVPVRILCDSGIVLEGHLFAPAQGRDGRPGRVLDLLNDTGQDFLPLRSDEDRLLLGKAGVIHVAVDAGHGELETLLATGGDRIGVRLTLVGGHVLVGQLLIDMPPPRARVLDYLNEAPRFIPLLADDRVTLVQKGCVTSVRNLQDDGS